MSNNFSLEKAVEVAVQSTVGIYKANLENVLVIFRAGIPCIYEDANFKNLIDETTLEEINYKLKLIAEFYKNVIQNKPSDFSVEIEMNSHATLKAVSQWEEWKEWAKDSCPS